RLLAWDNGAPLYYAVLHYWVLLWGNSDLSFRALSALFSTLSLFVFYRVARRVWSDVSFVSLSLALYSCLFFQVWYAKEARCYALFNCLLLVVAYCILLCLAGESVLRTAGLVAALTLALYTHNMVLFYLPGFAALWFLYPSEMT